MDHDIPLSKGYMVASEPYINKSLCVESTEHEAMRVAANINSKLDKNSHERFQVFEVLVHIKRNSHA